MNTITKPPWPDPLSQAPSQATWPSLVVLPVFSVGYGFITNRGCIMSRVGHGFLKSCMGCGSLKSSVGCGLWVLYRCGSWWIGGSWIGCVGWVLNRCGSWRVMVGSGATDRGGSASLEFWVLWGFFFGCYDRCLKEEVGLVWFWFYGLPKLGIAVVWFDFDFDFVGCRGCQSWGFPWFGLFFIFILWVVVILIFLCLKTTLVFNW